MSGAFRLEEQILRWREEVSRAGALLSQDAEELESHLLDIVDREMYAGASAQVAFERAQRIMGAPEDIGAEFTLQYREVYMDYEKQITEHRDEPEELERLYHEKPQAFASCLERVRENYPDAALLNAWHARLSYAPARAAGRRALGELLLMIGLCVAAGLAVKLPLLWGQDVWKVDVGAFSFYTRNFAFFFMPMIAAFHIVRQRPKAFIPVIVAALFLASLAIINVMPATEPFHTRLLSVLHLPLLLWLGVGAAFCGNEWRNPAARMDFLRSTGELFVYTVLILLGGGVLTGFTLGIFNLIGLDISRIYISWVAAVGLFAAPIVGAYLTENKRELVESFAPMLSWIFTPLVLVTLVVFLLTMAALRRNPYNDREFLLMFNGMLALVLALTVFNISERRMNRAARVFDAMNAVLIAVALAIDAIALSAILARLSTYGASPNRIAVLGANILLLGNLVGLAVQYVRFFAGKARFADVENLTAWCLPAYAAWLAVVAFLLPVLFHFA